MEPHDKIKKTGPQKSTEKITEKYIGELKIGDFTVPCAVLSNEERVIVQKEFVGMLTGTKKGGLERYLRAKNLEPYLPERFKGENWDLEILRFPIQSNISPDAWAHGLKSSDIVDILEMYLKARDAGVLLKRQVHLATKAEILVRAFAKVGLVALIDEATGYQKHRKKDAIRLLVESYIREDARQWTKEFTDSFFEELDNLYKHEKTTPQKRPPYYGRFINTYIYEPIERGIILKELKSLRGVSKNKQLHLFLNEAKGLSILRDRIGRITALLSISGGNMIEYKNHYDRMESKQKWFNFGWCLTKYDGRIEASSRRS